MVDYNKRLVEVDEILNYLSIDDLNKIPEEIRKLIKDNKDTEYEWHYDGTKPLKEQNVNRDTIAFLSYLNMEYLLNEEQKELMKQIHEFNEKKLEEEKNIKYSTENIFKNKSKQNLNEINNTHNNQLIEYKESLFKRILNKLKSFFK